MKSNEIMIMDSELFEVVGGGKALTVLGYVCAGIAGIAVATASVATIWAITHPKIVSQWLNSASGIASGAAETTGNVAAIATSSLANAVAETIPQLVDAATQPQTQQTGTVQGQFGPSEQVSQQPSQPIQPGTLETVARIVENGAKIVPVFQSIMNTKGGLEAVVATLDAMNRPGVPGEPASETMRLAAQIVSDAKDVVRAPVLNNPKAQAAAISALEMAVAPSDPDTQPSTTMKAISGVLHVAAAPVRWASAAYNWWYGTSNRTDSTTPLVAPLTPSDSNHFPGGFPTCTHQDSTLITSDDSDFNNPTFVDAIDLGVTTGVASN